MNEYEGQAEEQDMFALNCILKERGLQWMLEAITEQLENLANDPEVPERFDTVRYVAMMIKLRRDLFGWYNDPVVWTTTDRYGNKIEAEEVEPFKDTTGSGKYDSVRMLEAWKLKRP